MSKGNFPLYAFNRGEVSRFALGRVDLDRMRLSAEEQVNFQPMVLGPMTLRPGLEHLGSTRSNLKARFIPFVFGNDDAAALELTTGTPVGSPGWAAGTMRVWLDDEVVERKTVGTTVPNGDFSSATGWTLSPNINAQATGAISGGKLTLNARARGGVGFAWRAVTIPAGSRGVEHAFRIVVERGPVTFRCGTGGYENDDLIATTTLGEGAHSLAFKPGNVQSTVYVYFETHDMADRIVDSITIEAPGPLTLPTPWIDGDLDYVRHAQSGDVVFCACRGVHPFRIERRGLRSWSVVKFLTRNGPLKAVASVEELKLTPGAMYGNTTLTADRPFFTQDHVGCLFRLFQNGQTKRTVLAGADQYTEAIRITGVGTRQRDFSFVASGAFTGTLVLQRSTEDGDIGVGFVDTGDVIIGPLNTPQVAKNHLDLDKGNFNNVICFYRVGFKDDGHTSGAAVVEFRDQGGIQKLTSGGGAGVCRITGVTDATHSDIEILEPFNSLAAATDWQEGEWSDVSGYPSAVAFHDGRLWWAGGDKVWASVSDDYSNFNLEKEGDAAPISRSVGYGPVDTISWMLPLTRLILGREGAETSVRSSSLDEPITAATFTLRDCSTKGSARVAAVKCDTRGVFVSKSGRKVYELALDMQAADYAAHELTRLNPDIAGGGFTRLCIQHNPDTAIHFVRADGAAAVLLYDKEDEVEAWWRVETDGVIEDAFVLPGVGEDNVYYVVQRTIGGETKRYLEKFAHRDRCSGLPEARLADSHIIDDEGDKTIGGLSHLEGKSVVAWGWNDGATAGVDLGSFTVANGQIGLSAAYNKVCVGLPYEARFTSAKLAYAAEQGTAINQRKRVEHVGLLLFDTHCRGLQYGQRADLLDDLPLVSEGEPVTANTVHAAFDQPMIEVPGEWNTDARLHLKASAPRPCTIAAAVIGLQTHG